MLIRRKVAVKTVITEQSKAELISRLRHALSEVTSTQARLEQQGREFLSEISRKDPAKGEAFRKRLERQLKQQADIKDGLTEELGRVEALKPGAEYLQDTVDGFVDIHVGDNLSEKLGSAEILVKDGVVVRMRQ